MPGKETLFASPLFVACCLLTHHARKMGMTSFCAITTLGVPQALCRLQPLRGLSWEPPNLPPVHPPLLSPRVPN